MRILIILGLLAVAGNLPALPMSVANYPLTGRVTVAESGNGLEYATVSAYRDSTLVDGTVTDATGNFALRLPEGTYRLRIEFIGFARREIAVRLLGATELEAVVLAAEDVNLEAVEVTAERSRMTLSLDKKSFAVGQDLLSRGGSAHQVLEQLPSVDVSADGAVSLRGNTGVKVLINGRPSALADNNALESIPAESIERVEIITNPSARYEAAGTAGIINVILKADRNRGYGGSVSVTAGYPADHRLNANLNLRREKFTTFLTAGTRYANFRGHDELFRENRTGSGDFSLERTMDQDRNDRAANAFAGIDYRVSESATLSASYSLYAMVNEDAARTDYDLVGGTYPNGRRWQQAIDYLEPGIYQQLDLTYSTETAGGGKLTAYLKNDLWNENETERSTFTERHPEVGDFLDYESTVRESSRDHLLQLDYEQPWGERGTLEAGLRGETRVIIADYRADNLLGPAPEVVPGFDNRLDYFERIGSAYLQYSREGEKLGYQLGLRNEYTLVRTENDSDGAEDLRKPYNRLFPTANVSYRFDEGWSAQLGYSKRIRRPGFWQLNPFMTLTDPNSIFYGDPDLDPAYTDRVEVNLVRQTDKLTVNPAVYASRTSDFFQFIFAGSDENVFGLENGTVVTRPVNLDREDRLGLELTGNYRPVEGLSLSGEFNYFAYRQRGQYQALDFDYAQRSWSAGLRIAADVPGGVQLQAGVNYRAPFRSVQQVQLANYTGQFGASREWGEKLTVSLSVRSPSYAEFEIDLPGLYERGSSYRTGWRLALTAAYKLERGAASRERQARGNIR